MSIRFLGMAPEKPRLVLLPEVSPLDLDPDADPEPRNLDPLKPQIIGSVTEPGCKDEDMPGPASVAQRLVVYRARLARMTGEDPTEAMKSSRDMDGSNVKFMNSEELPESMANWNSDMVKVRETARRLSSAIREMTDIIFSDDFELHGLWRYALSIRWPISCVTSEDSQEGHSRPDTIYVTLRRSSPKAPWTLDPAHVEAILSLWLWSLKKDESFSAHSINRASVTNERIVGHDFDGPWALLRLPPVPQERHRSRLDTSGFIKSGRGYNASDVRNLWVRRRVGHHP